MEPVPINDILSRQSRLQELLIESDIELALIRQTADLYYYSGVIVDGFLALGRMARTAAPGAAAAAPPAGTGTSFPSGFLSGY